jgi:hypothetical protein
MKQFTIEKFPLIGFVLGSHASEEPMAICATSAASRAALHTTKLEDDYRTQSTGIGAAIPITPPSYSAFVKLDSKYMYREREFLGFELAGFPKVNWRQRAKKLLRERIALAKANQKAKRRKSKVKHEH